MMQVVKAPEPWQRDGRCVLFLAGSIEMGSAIKWQEETITALSTQDFLVLNPRRDDWDATWVQSIANQQFKEQVEWELRGLEAADVVLICFDPSTKSPITLLELGLVTGHAEKRVLVCCPDGFWRQGNVEIVCQRYGIPMFKSLADALAQVVRGEGK